MKESGDSFCVVSQHPSLVDYVDSLQKKNAESLSFYPRAVFERESEAGRILLSLLNGEPCGYIYMGSGASGTLRCHQVCIQYDARRRMYGTQLAACLEERAVRLSCDVIRLRCGFDLDANEFWKSLGYVCVRHDTGGVRRQRTINVWERVVSPMLFEVVGIDPAVGKTSAALWAKHKHTGIITQFVRGKQMRDYRAMLESKPTEPGAQS